jgi:DNA polymerase elongation subunit (family B)
MNRKASRVILDEEDSTPDRNKKKKKINSDLDEFLRSIYAETRIRKNPGFRSKVIIEEDEEEKNDVQEEQIMESIEPENLIFDENLIVEKTVPSDDEGKEEEIPNIKIIEKKIPTKTPRSISFAPQRVAENPIKSLDNSSGRLPLSQPYESLIPIVTIPEGNEIKLYWIDAQEIAKGNIVIFGKLYSSSATISITVKEINRKFYLFPRASKEGIPINDQMIYDEVDSIMSKYKISSWTMKRVTLKNAFYADIPTGESDWIQVSYSFSFPELRISSGNTFSHVVGINTPALEIFLLETGLMGPCWISLREITSGVTVTWCSNHFETTFLTRNTERISLGDGYNISKINEDIPEPPLTFMSLSIKTTMNFDRNITEILSLSFVHGQINSESSSLPQDDHLSCIRHYNGPLPIGFSGDKITVVSNEKSLINWFLAFLTRLDPDIIIGHNFLGYDLDVLLHRMKDHKIEHWSKLGRLRLSA